MMKRFLSPKLILSLIFYASAIVFFGFIYKYYLLFAEQQQLFLFDVTYLIKTLNNPGGFLIYTGEFLTQFYYFPIVGAIIISGFLFLVQLAALKLLKAVKSSEVFYPMSFIPSFFYGLLLCNDFYYLSGLIGLSISLWVALLYVEIQNKYLRFTSGILFLPILSFLIGGAYIVFLLIISVWETMNFIKKEKNRNNLLIIIIYLSIAIVFPLILRQFYVNTIMQSYLTQAYYKLEIILPLPLVIMVLVFPVLMLITRIVPDMTIEKRKGLIVFILQSVVFFGITLIAVLKSSFWGASDYVTYDYFARKGEWKQIVEKAKEKNPNDKLSLVYLNLALSKTGQLGNLLFNFKQSGINGLLLGDENKSFEPFLAGSELYYHLGLVNVSQYFAFEAMEISTDHKKNVRCLKRLAETNLINYQYEVAGKYLKILEKTLFYSKWAKETMTCLYNEDKINNHQEWGLLRKINPKSQYFFTYNQVDVILRIALKDNPKNLRAFEYLMSYYLLNKDLKSFKSYYTLGKEALTSNVPVSFQEAIIYIISHQVNQLNQGNIPSYIAPETLARLSSYANIYTSSPNSIALLEKDFKNTFWFYLHFR